MPSGKDQMRAIAGHSLRRLLRERRGSMLAEYGLIIGVVVLALVGVTMTWGGIVALWERLATLVIGA
jgi:Flp pilus assembly pilin Flp